MAVLTKMGLNVAGTGPPNIGGNDATSPSLGNKSTTPVCRRRTALHYDSESSAGNVSVRDGIEATSCDVNDSTIPTSSAGQSDDILPPVSTLFADRQSPFSAVPVKIEPDHVSTANTTTKPQISVAQVTTGQTTAQRPPAARKRPPRVRKPSKRSRANRNEDIRQQQQQQLQQQNGLLIMQKLLGSMTSLLRREITPLMTSFPVVTCSQRSPTVQSLPLSMFCAGAVGGRMPCGPLAHPNLLTPPGTNGPLMPGAVRGPMVRPVVWPNMLAAGTTPGGRRAPLTANASTSAPLLANSRSGRQKSSSSAAEEARVGAATGQGVNQLELMTVATLRDECRRRRLPTGGPKPNLIRRLLQNNFDASFNCVSTASYIVSSHTSSSSSAVVQSTAAQRQLVTPPQLDGPSRVVSSSASKSSSPVTTTTASSEARASLSQSQAIVARILSIRAAQKQRSAELAAATSSTTSSPASSSTSCSTSTAVVGSVPATVVTPPGAPNSEVVTAITRTMCAPAVAATLRQLNQATNTQRSAALANNLMSPANLMNGAQSLGQLMPLTADKQHLQRLGQNPGQPSPSREELWRLKETGPALLVGQQRELGQQRVQGQNVGQGEGQPDLWRARDTQSQVTLCRQQQMLIYELRRQLEQSRRALIEAQAGELKLGADQPHRPETSGDFPASPTAQTAADSLPKLQIPAGVCSRSLDYTGVVPNATCASGLSFPLHDPHPACTSAAILPQHLQPKNVSDGSLHRNHQLTTSLQRNVQLGLLPTQHTLVSSFIAQYRHVLSIVIIIIIIVWIFSVV